MQRRSWRVVVDTALVGLGLGVRPVAATTRILGTGARRRRRSLGLLAAGLVLAKVVLPIEAQPAAAGTGAPRVAGLPSGGSPDSVTSWSVSLSASASNVQTGATVTLTATANQSVTGTGYFIDIFDQATGEGEGCTTGSTCQAFFTNAQPGSHTYVAYVDSDPVFHYSPCCVAATSNTVTVTWYDRATTAFDVEFAVDGTLPAFPCAGGCNANLTGAGSGTGKAQATSGLVGYDATFALPSGSVTGSAYYTEPDGPLCPAFGFAAGTVSLTGGATGTVTRTSTPTVVGAVTAVTFSLDFSYQRVASGTEIQVTGGTAVVSFAFPDTGASYFVAAVSGRGLGAFVVDPATAVDLCDSPGPLAFRAVGDVALSGM